LAGVPKNSLRPWTSPAARVSAMSGTIGELSAEDLTLLGFLDALVTKNRLKALAGGVSSGASRWVVACS
jgi:hypothetical protein